MPHMEELVADHGAPLVSSPQTEQLKAAKLRKKLEKQTEARQKKGVVYVSRVPPHMKPQKLRHLLEQHGEVGRLYLAAEDAAMRKRRKKQGGNSGKNFSEGWVEFLDKRVAKAVAAQLNGSQIGGKRRSAYHYDLWCLKYLPRFKWDHLTEEIAYEKAVREQRLAAEISAAKRERDFYMERVDQAKAQEAKLVRRQKRAAEAGDAKGAGALDTAAQSGEQQMRILRAYGQKRPKIDPSSSEGPVLSADVLNLIGGKRKQAT